MKSIQNWYVEEMKCCLMELLDENHNPDRKHERGWLERAEFSLDVIEAFISSSMKIGCNPLSPLRKQFPFLEWKYINYGDNFDTRTDIQICKDVSFCDFFWFAIDTQGWHLVLATRQEIPDGQVPQSLFGSTCKIEPEELSGTSMADRKYSQRYLATKKIRNAE